MYIKRVYSFSLSRFLFSELSAMHQGIKSAQMHLGEEDVEGFELLDEEDEDEDEEEENHANRNISSLLQNATRGAEDDRADAEGR